MKRAITSALFSLLLSGAAVFAQDAPKHAAAKPVNVDIINAEGHSVGTAVLSEAQHGVKITLAIKDMPPGAHLMHIHEFPECVPPDFKSAGAHFNPSGASHDGHGPAGPPAGDIPNFVLTVAADGTAHTSVIAPYVTLGNEPNSVFTNGGTALVFHAVAGHVSASAPPRIACGIIARPQ
ncbi:MAG: superoxide dismutase family protein [Candidatus Acidiferrales bacterium]